MSLDLPDGARCFVDANVFYYHFVNTPPMSEPCTTLMERMANGTIEVYTSLHILADAVHKVMLTERLEATVGMSHLGKEGASPSQAATYGEGCQPGAPDPPDSPNPPHRNRH